MLTVPCTGMMVFVSPSTLPLISTEETIPFFSAVIVVSFAGVVATSTATPAMGSCAPVDGGCEMGATNGEGIGFAITATGGDIIIR